MIFCCGEALIDMLPRKLEDGSDVFLPVAGGAVFNTAIALGRLGVETGFVSGISNDMFGEQLVESLQASKVAANYCVRSDYPTTLAFVKLTNGHAQYTFIDEKSAGRMLNEDDLPALPDNLEALHFGAISLIPEPCGSAFETLMARHKDKAVISLDPNIRPGFIDDPQSHKARIRRMIAMSDIVKVSDEDLDWLEAENQQGLIEDWLSGETKLVLLTKGSKGVTAFTRDGVIDHPAPKAKVVDTIGAGDTFNAGLLTGLKDDGLLDKQSLANITEQQLKPALEMATRTAAYVVSQAGANPPWREELND